MIHYSTEVASAKKSGSPIVALESTIISHGLPRPKNLAVALEVEEIVRSEGATPATIAIIEGEIHV
ncbi:MAG: pseudouridine-5'-phosphate glycosidase, partial [Actinomycetota bacterium]